MWKQVCSKRWPQEAYKLSVHEGIFRYQCENKFTVTDDLKKHKMSVHVGIRYYCDQCDFKATQKK